MKHDSYAPGAGMGAPALSTETDERKTFITMKAKAALCGCTLHELSDGYLVGRWNCSKAVPFLRAMGGLLRQIGGR